MKQTIIRLGYAIIASLLAITMVACAGKKQAQDETAAATPSATPSVESIDVRPSETGAEIVIGTSAPVSPVNYSLENPPRVIVDIPNAVPGASIQKTYIVESPIVSGIQISTQGSANAPLVRIEVTLKSDGTSRLDKQDGVLVLSIAGAAPVVAAAPVPPAAPVETPVAILPTEEVPASESGTVPSFLEAAPSDSSYSEAAPSNLPPATRILDVKTAPEGEMVKVIITTNGAVGGFNAFELPSPPRIVVDMAGVSTPYASNKVSVGDSHLNSVRLGKHPGKVRIVLDLPAMTEYSTSKQGDKLVIYLGPGAKAAAPSNTEAAAAVVGTPSEASDVSEPASNDVSTEPSSPVFAPTEEPTFVEPTAPVMPSPEAPASESGMPAVAGAASENYDAVEVTDVIFNQEGDKNKITVVTSGRAKYEVVANDRDNLVSLRIINASISADKEKSQDTSAFAGSVRMVSSYQWNTGDSKDVYITLTMNFTTDYYVVREGNSIIMLVDNPASGRMAAMPRGAEYAAGPSSAGAEEGGIQEDGSGPGGAQFYGGVEGSVRKHFSGRLVYLDYQSIDLIDALSLLAEVAGLNLVAPDVKAKKISLKLEAVPWDQALDIILRSTQLGGVIRGNILRIDDLKSLEEEERKFQDAKKRRTIEMPLDLRVFFVSYADVAEVSKQIDGMLTPGRGKYKVDKRTSSLFVWDTTDKLNEIEGVVRKLDVETPQVLIEARIVEARSNFGRTLGVNWGINYHSGAAYGNPTGLNFPGTADVGVGLVSGVSGAAGSATALGTNAVGITLGSLTRAIDLDLLLKASELDNDVKVISSPRILTLDNETANITQGTAIPFATTSAAGTQTQFVDANLKIEVTPHVTSDGRISLEVSVQNNSPDYTVVGATGPGINKSEAKTQILVKDGETMVIGGIYVHSSSHSGAYTPGLGRLPVIGWLFRERTEAETRRELLIFLTPRVVSGGEQYLRSINTTNVQ